MTGQRLSAHTGVSQFVPIQPLYGAKQGAQEGVLLINLGSPASPSVADVRSYLETFLMDERVISIAPFWRSLLVRRIIGPRRAPHSASNYAKIWDAESGTFPLVRSSARLAHELSIRLEKPVGLAMRYGKPEMDEALLALQGLGVQRIKLLPLYPHYTRSSFETAVVHALERAKALGVEAELEIVPPFYNDKLYRQVLAGSIRPYLEEPFDKLIISMHGIPMTHLSRPCQASNGDRHRCLEHQHSPQEQMTCYRLHCESTYTYLCQDLGLAPEQVELVYQSRLGLHEWIKPYFSRRVKAWPQEGAQRIVVVCPGFVCDCLETLEEINVDYRHRFLASGGKSFTYVPCVGNTGAAFIDVLEHLLS